MAERPRHPVKEIEQFIRDAERHGWRITKGRKYYKAYCACGLHLLTIHLTPSSQRYAANLRHRFARLECW